MSNKLIKTHKDDQAYQKAFCAAMEIFERITEKSHTNPHTAANKKRSGQIGDSLTDQIRRSSRSVCANLAEAWRKRRYEAAFIAKLNDSEAEAASNKHG